MSEVKAKNAAGQVVSIKQTRYDNWYGYVAGKRVESFGNSRLMTAEEAARAWLQGQTSVKAMGITASDASDRVSCSVKASDESAIAQDAERRMIKQFGMPFPIAEDKQLWATQKYAAGKPFAKSVSISLLTATQRDFDPDKVQSMMHNTNDNEPIQVVHHMNRYIIPDGHHRAMAAKFRGDTVVPAMVVES